ncbi:hypothetical protein H6P81_011887 [Aristolochia fimbriata]|uniref:Uncharacterized protein n=1 Tax=Aristolochia fimbriata TaxID=158543 RepID=A0AAV7EAM3_ARIFI|nr:hypothetical protein H6P81_011887 [Aristolochia fimbriata]
MGESEVNESKHINEEKKKTPCMASDKEQINGLEDRNVSLPKLIGVDVKNFHGSWKRRHKGKNAVIYPWETYMEMAALGFGSVVSLSVAFWVHLLLSYWTLPGWIPSPLFPIYMQEMDESEKGSGSDGLNFVGRIVTSYVETIFRKCEDSPPCSIHGR